MMPIPPDGWKWVVLTHGTMRPSVHLTYKDRRQCVRPQILEARSNLAADIVAAANTLLTNFTDTVRERRERQAHRESLAEELGCTVY